MYQTPQEAEAAFYHAMEAGSLDSMMRVWAPHDRVECIHPLGHRLQGRSAIEDGWRDIFGAGTSMRFQVRDARYVLQGGLAVHVVHEHIELAGPQGPRVSRIIATNVYEYGADGWRMVLHHASPAPNPRRPTNTASPVVH